MEQHPIPQQISSYQFRLVGDMTLKQFFQLAGGILVGLLFYSSPLLPIIKWPFAIVSVILGIALAFLPLEERPLEKWLLAFFRAVYSPTLYYWKKTNTPVKFFEDENPTDPNAPKQEAALQSYLGINKKVGPLQNLEAAEKTFLSQLTNLFSGVVPQSTATPVQTPVSAPVAIPVVVPTPTVPSTPVTNQMTQAPETQPAQQGIQIPETPAIRIAQDIKPKFVVEEKVADLQPLADIQVGQVSPVIAGNEMITTRAAVFSIDAAPPSPPTSPNTIVGQIVDEEKKIVEGAIMEIKDSLGRPIRALRSNKLGHFITVTPLENGRYEIVTDKDGFEFNSVIFEAAGTIIPPILVQGKRISAPVVDQTSQPPTEQPVNPVQNQTVNTNVQFS